MVYYELVKITIDIPDFAEVILDVVIQYQGLLDLIVSDCGSFFTLKFWSSLYYFLKIKQRLKTAFHPQMDGQIEGQNSTMEIYLKVFVNYKQNDWARLFLMAEFTYNNTKNASTGHTSFELDCGYHPCISYKEDIDSRFKSKLVDEWSTKLWKLMTVCKENLYYALEL